MGILTRSILKIFKVQWLLLFILLMVSTTTSAQYSPKLSDDRQYHLLIVAKQWEYDIFDLRELDTNITDLLNLENSTDFEIDQPEIHVEKDTSAIIHFVSADVQHGLKIGELDFELIANRPTPEQDYGIPANGTIDFPNEDAIYKTEAHIFAGLGTPDMVITFVVGEQNPFSLPVPFFPALFALFAFSVLLRSNSDE